MNGGSGRGGGCDEGEEQIRSGVEGEAEGNGEGKERGDGSERKARVEDDPAPKYTENELTGGTIHVRQDEWLVHARGFIETFFFYRE